MKRLPVLYILLISLFLLPIILISLTSQNADIRSKADDSTTPTATPSTTPTTTPTPTITPTPTNAPPGCNGISANPGSGAKPLTVNFSCAGYDPNNDITAVEFGFGNDQKRLVEKNVGQFGSITTSYTYDKAGSYNVTCRVRDNNMTFSDYPGYCTYTVVVTENSLTPTPQRSPTPTRVVTKAPVSPNTDAPLILTGDTASTPTPTATIAPAPTTRVSSFWNNEKVAQLVMMVLVSGVTIVAALLLHGFFDKR